MLCERLCHLRHLGQIADQDHAAETVIEEIAFPELSFSHILELHCLIQKVRVLTVVPCRKKCGIQNVPDMPAVNKRAASGT